MDANGILLVDKPLGWSSHDVVAKVRGILKGEAGGKIKVGHTGTLDPLATGLMILVVGSYCKRAMEFSKLDKTYEVTMELGQNSNTGDAEGETFKVSDKRPSKKELNSAISDFSGEIIQTPPVYSAIKIHGKRAYQIAREGKKVKLEPRKVTIKGINSIEYVYPTVKFTTEVSSGTYIRSLVQDIGEKLQTGAYMSALYRSRVGNYSIDVANKVEKVSIDKIIEA